MPDLQSITKRDLLTPLTDEQSQEIQGGEDSLMLLGRGHARTRFNMEENLLVLFKPFRNPDGGGVSKPDGSAAGRVVLTQFSLKQEYPAGLPKAQSRNVWIQR
jgi:hypothetical protein